MGYFQGHSSAREMVIMISDVAHREKIHNGLCYVYKGRKGSACMPQDTAKKSCELVPKVFESKPPNGQETDVNSLYFDLCPDLISTVVSNKNE